MSKSIQINQSMRANVAHQLTVAAVKSSAAELKKTLAATNAEFWDRHIKRIEKKTGMDRGQFAPLIAENIFASTMSAAPKVKKFHEIDGEQKMHWRHPFIVDMRGAGWDAIEKVMRDPAIDLIGHSAPLWRSDWGRAPYCIRFEHTKPVPSCKDMSLVTTKKMVAQLESAADQITRLIDSVKGFHSETIQILGSCRTSRQLEDIFPEAAKLLPPPAKKTGQMIPQEKADQVRALLKSGIPA